MNMSEKTKNVHRILGHALVLGGSGGIGRPVVLALAANGASAVSFTYGRNEKAALELAAELKGLGVQTFFAPVDRLDERGLMKFLDDAVAAVGEEITMAVDTIGISPNQSHEEQNIDSTERKKEGWLQVFQTNVFGSFTSLRAIAQRMKEKKVQGAIVLITSSNGVNSQAEYSVHYTRPTICFLPPKRSLRRRRQRSGSTVLPNRRRSHR